MTKRRSRGRHRAPFLGRRRSRLEPKRRFFLYCEGRNTEPAYFSAIRRACSNALIRVETHGGVGVPYTIAKTAVEFAESKGLTPRRRRRRDSYEENDEVWAVFDRDDHPRFDEAVRHCERNSVQVARSNPCFELWLILHERDYNRPNRRKQVQIELKKLRADYDPDSGKSPDCDELVSRVHEAEERAEIQLRNRELDDSPYGNPSTTVGRLTRAIREASELSRPQAHAVLQYIFPSGNSTV